MLILVLKLISSITKNSISKQKRRMLSKIFAKSAYLVKNSPLLFSAKFFKSDKMPSPKRAPFFELERDFLDPKTFYEQLISQDITFFTGVPDSLLKDFCGYVSDHHPQSNHVIAANEGNAIGIAAGYHLATGRFPLVYLQNSGLGNIINPIMSLCHNKVYSIPMLLIIGWRGEPGKKDEPQHLVMGKTTQGFLTEMNIKFEVLPDYIEGAQDSIEAALFHMKNSNSPYAFIVKRQTFLEYNFQKKEENNYPLNREQAVELVLEQLDDHAAIVSTTGFLSRELYEIRTKKKEGQGKDFMCVGSMGHASSIALGLALQKPSRNVVCFDGDGAALMHLGTMSNIGNSNCTNLIHILFNNGCHDSVGGQPTQGLKVNFQQLALACGYKDAISIESTQQIQETVKQFMSKKGPNFIEIKIKPGARDNLGRPKSSTLDNKKKFMEFLRL